MIDRYVVATRGVAHSSGEGSIACLGPSNELLLIRFMPGPPSENYSAAKGNFGVVNVPVTHFSWYLDLLRNEKPIWAFVDSRPERNALASRAEPAGDLELFQWRPTIPAEPVKVDDWLKGRASISKALVWETSTAAISYAKWPAKQKKQLREAVANTLAASGTALTDPPPNLANPADDAAPLTVISEENAWKLYVATVAHCLALDMANLLPWRLVDLQPDHLQILLDSRQFFRWDASYGAYRLEDTNGYAVPADPSTVRRFLVQNFLLGTTRFDTITRVLEWCRHNLAHHFGDTYVSGKLDTASMEAHWHYRGYPPVSRVIAGTSRVPPPFGSSAFHHWTAGCWGTSGFLRCVLRIVNIPVIVQRICGHALPGFPSEARFLSHGDDPYSYGYGHPPKFPTADLLISEATFQAWFGAGVTEEQRCMNVGRRSQELNESHSGSGDMPYSSFKVETYSVVLGGDFFDSGADAVIVCRGAGGQALLVLFHPAEKSLPANISTQDLEFGILNVSSEKFPWYIDLLRNEKPVMASVNSSVKDNSLSTGQEPVGEEERGDAIWEAVANALGG